MADSFPLKLVTPTGVMFDGAAELVTAVGPLGEFGVLAQHVNFISSLIPSILTLKQSGEQARPYLISGGLAEVRDGALTILATEAMEPPKLEFSAVMGEIAAAEEKLAHVSFCEPGYEEAEHALQLARARLRAAELKPAN